jgi:hypothetical protein
MSPAGVGNLLPGDLKSAPTGFFTRISFPDVLANIAQGAKETTQQNLSRPDVSDHIFQSGTCRQKQNN